MSFCSLIKGITPNSSWLCFVLVNSVPFSSSKNRTRQGCPRSPTLLAGSLAGLSRTPRHASRRKQSNAWRPFGVTPTHPLCEQPQTYTLQGPTGWSAFGPGLTTWFSLSFPPVAVRPSNVRQFVLTLSASATSEESSGTRPDLLLFYHCLALLPVLI